MLIQCIPDNHAVGRPDKAEGPNYPFNPFSVFFSLIGQFGLDGIHRFAVFAIVVWSFFLDILAIRANYGFGKGKAFFISISPFLLCGMLITALFVIGIMTALAGISELQDVEGIINSF